MRISQKWKSVENESAKMKICKKSKLAKNKNKQKIKLPKNENQQKMKITKTWKFPKKKK